MIYQGKARYPVTEVILHTTATSSKWWRGKTADEMADQVRQWHKDRGWRDIGYHRLFAPDGTIAIGRSIYEIGAHTRNRNRGTIGLAMVNVNAHKGITRFEDYFTEDQRAAVKAYIAELGTLTDIKVVSGHNDYTNAKECPGFKVQSSDWLAA